MRMKWVVWLLILVNLGLFGYFKLNESHPVEIVVGHEAIQADKIKILTAEELAAMSKKNEAAPVPAPVAQQPIQPPTPMQTACYEWGSFSKASIPRARSILEKFSVTSELKETATQEATRYWVYIPPLPSAEKAQAKFNEVRAMGVSEIFVVQEPQWRNAISFGVFKDETLATKLLEDLHARGIKSAVKGTRNHESGQSIFLIKDVTENVAEEIGKLQPDFPGSELKKITCP